MANAMSVAMGIPHPRALWPSRVDEGVQQRRNQDAAERRKNGKRGLTRRGQFSCDQLSLNFQAHDEEKYGHQSVVNPEVELMAQGESAQPHR